ncbi:MAG: hypothetical protein ACI8R4_001727 [Paracoccaceae bacterium]|jgi:hypothetical protein
MTRTPRCYLLPIVVSALVGLAGCSLDKESAVRAQLGAWVKLGETLYFDSRFECTAGVFETGSDDVHLAAQTVSLVADGVRLIGQKRVVAFDVPGQSPTLVSEAIMSSDLPKGLGILNAGVGAKNCMDDEVQHAYLKVLTTPGGILIFDPAAKVMAILDRAGDRVFFMRVAE